MTEEDGFRIEAALDMGFECANDDCTEYRCTEEHLLKLIRASENVGRMRMWGEIYG